MFEKVLIANRGEIAVRVVRACHALGVRTVAVYSDADRQGLHVRYADEAYPIGPALARKSYLRIERIIEAAQVSGAEAIHPGYGFLAENPQLAAACDEAGIVFIGPAAGAISAMGDKVRARQVMQEAGVPTVPGSRLWLQNGELLATAEDIGFPLFVKAAAGGGGKGMRLVLSSKDLEHSLEAARREAEKAFGDERLYLERAIQNARHIEIQILADQHGNVIHLGERECSIQRRHQKLIEEAPSPAVNEELRQRMGQVAIKAAKAVGYTNAGTVEFLLDKDGSYYFLEMNTRLQVEHPITESITGIDIVKEQLRIAAGKKLHFAQSDLKFQGHAIECRITAEDPFSSFLPATGRIVRLFQPNGPGIRVDSGIHQGSEISLYYDPLLAKLIAWGGTRHQAIRRMRSALREFRIIGIPSSIPFHQWVMDNDAFQRGEYDTSFLQDQFSLGEPERESHRHLAALVATLVSHKQRQQTRLATLPWDDDGRGDSWRSGRSWKLAGRQEAMD
jgi:acetyl-CoA carboxylase biotin carboxylase subunit